MDFIIDVATNYPLMSAAAGWFIAQILKTATGVFKVKKFSLAELFFGTGGMPSSHAASVSALACACAVKDGVASHTFAISIVLALIVMRDAMGMRRQIGEISTPPNTTRRPPKRCLPSLQDTHRYRSLPDLY